MGGAAIACRRLMDTLNQIDGFEAKMLVQEKKTTHSQVFGIADNWLKKKFAFARFALERLHFTFYEKSKEVRFGFSTALTGIDVLNHPLVQEADIIHLHWINFGFLSIDSLQKLFTLNKPIVWTLHDMWAFTGGCHHSGVCENYQNQCGNCTRYLKNPAKNDLSRSVLRKKNLAFTKKETKIVACSEWLANRAKKSSLFKNLSVQAIPNPIDIQLFKPLDRVSVRNKLGLLSDKKLILFVAAKVSVIWKGFSYFIEALNLMKDDKNTELIIMGEAEEELISQLPFRTHALGRINDVNRIVEVYNAADVFVIPSIEENLPNTIMEALSCGIPSVGFETGGIPEMIEHRQTGYLAKYRDAEDLKNGIRWVLNEADSAKLSQNARQKAENYYAEKVVVEQYLEVYEAAKRI
jgi:glycosyltransferase involved in cell wall biosynthesis